MTQSLLNKIALAKESYATIIHAATHGYTKFEVIPPKGKGCSFIVTYEQLMSKYVHGAFWWDQEVFTYIRVFAQLRYDDTRPCKNDYVSCKVLICQRTPTGLPVSTPVPGPVPVPVPVPVLEKTPWVRPTPAPKWMSPFLPTWAPVQFLNDEEFECAYHDWLENNYNNPFLQKTWQEIAHAWETLCNNINLPIEGGYEAQDDGCGYVQLASHYDPDDWHHAEGNFTSWGTARSGDLRCMTGTRLWRYLWNNIHARLLNKSFNDADYVALVPFRRFMLNPNLTTTIEDLMEEAKTALEHMWRNEYDYQSSEECFYNETSGYDD